jgi:SAM-dependent methyltransferase
MELPATMRTAVRSILGPSVIRYIRHIGTPRVQDVTKYQMSLSGRHALEIGGPSDIFAYDGSLPVYPVLGSVDNCLFSSDTVWTGKVDDRFYYDAHRRQGAQFFCEATDLEPIADASYECVLASHSLEHTTNPLKALKEFQRVLKPDGLLLVVLPQKDGTFDWRRPLTPLSHMVRDYTKDVPEDDLTHLPEVLALHDIARDSAKISFEQFRERCLRNREFRIMHHHTFDKASAIALIEFAGFQTLRTETVKPYHIIILAQPVTRT